MKTNSTYPKTNFFVTTAICACMIFLLASCKADTPAIQSDNSSKNIEPATVSIAAEDPADNVESSYDASTSSESPEKPKSELTVKSGDAYLDANLVTEDGTPCKISDFSDKPMYIVFWEDWCPQCKAELPILQRLYESYGDDINFVTINRLNPDTEAGEMEETRKFIEENNFTFPVFYNINKEATEIYGHPSIPTNIFVDKDGIVKATFDDSIDITEDMARSWLESISN